MTDTATEKLFQEIYVTHRDRAINYARRRYNIDYDTADQIVADAFLCLHETLSLGVKIEHVNTWMRHNIHARYVDLLRRRDRIRLKKKRYWRQIPLHDDIVAQEHAGFAEIECEEVLQLALQDLLPKERRLAKYVLIDGRTMQEASRRFRVCERTIERRLGPIREKLRALCFSLVSC